MFSLSQIKVVESCRLDSETLTAIAFSAKRHWKYPSAYYETWKDELTITPQYISDNRVCSAIYKGTIVGFYSIVENHADFYSGEVFVAKGIWLEHLFILPEYHKLGIGGLLMDHLKAALILEGKNRVYIFVDPFASGFYNKLGAKFLYESKSSIPNRLIPVYEWRIL